MTGDAARWDGLFADLEAQAAAAGTTETAAEADARSRGEWAEVGLADRLRAALQAPVRVTVAGPWAVHGVLQRVGPDWLAVLEETGREAVVPLAAVRQVAGLTRWAEAPGSAGAVAARLGLRSALRAVVRDRSPVRVHLVDGDTVDATLDRVGADHVDLAVHAAGEVRRRRAVHAVVAVPLAALAAVRRDAGGWG